MNKYNNPQEQDQADKVLFRLIIIMCFGIALMYCTSSCSVVHDSTYIQCPSYGTKAIKYNKRYNTQIFAKK